MFDSANLGSLAEAILFYKENLVLALYWKIVMRNQSGSNFDKAVLSPDIADAPKSIQLISL